MHPALLYVYSVIVNIPLFMLFYYLGKAVGRDEMLLKYKTQAEDLGKLIHGRLKRLSKIAVCASAVVYHAEENTGELSKCIEQLNEGLNENMAYNMVEIAKKDGWEAVFGDNKDERTK